MHRGCTRYGKTYPKLDLSDPIYIGSAGVLSLAKTVANAPASMGSLWHDLDVCSSGLSDIGILLTLPEYPYHGPEYLHDGLVS